MGRTMSSYLSGRRRKLRSLSIVFMLVWILFYLYPLRAAENAYSEVRHFQKWAELWDIRDLNIREAKSQGMQDVEVMHLDKVITWAGELSGDPDF